MPAAAMRLVLPRGAPRSASDFSFFFAHFIHASMPAFICSGVAFFICSTADMGARYSAINFFMAIIQSLEMERVFPKTSPLLESVCQQPEFNNLRRAPLRTTELNGSRLCYSIAHSTR